MAIIILVAILAALTVCHVFAWVSYSLKRRKNYALLYKMRTIHEDFAYLTAREDYKQKLYVKHKLKAGSKRVQDAAWKARKALRSNSKFLDKDYYSWREFQIKLIMRGEQEDWNASQEKKR